MQQIKNQFTSIEQMAGQLLQPPKQETVKSGFSGVSFEQIFRQKSRNNAPESETTGLRFSKHANERLQSRQIDLSTEQVKRLEAGAAKAGEKGIVESLVMVDDYAFIVNTRNRIVVTAVTGNEDKVFTNIDGAVIG